MKKKFIILGIIVACLLTAAFFEPFITSIIILSFAMIFLINSIIGVSSGLIIARLYNIPKKKAIWTLIIADFISFIFAVSLFLSIDICKAWPLSPSIYNLWQTYYTMLLIFFFLHMSAKIPFVIFLFFKDKNWLKKTISSFLIIELISFFLFVGERFFFSEKPVIDATLVPISSINLPKDVSIYFVGENDHQVYMCKTPGEIFKIKMYDWEKISSGDLIISSFCAKDGMPYSFVFYKDYGLQSIFNCNYKHGDNDSLITQENNDYPEYKGVIRKLGSAAKSKWTFKISARQLEGFNAETGEKVLIRTQSIIPDSEICFATHLPGDKVIFQFGKNQICVYDPVAKKLALFVRGRGPVAILDDTKK